MTDERDSLPTFESVPRIRAHMLEPGYLSCVVFGPGEGEAIVVFLPDGAVCVVDGCREPTDGNGRDNPVHELLNELEAIQRKTRGDPSWQQDIDVLCLTHPHQDHYRGIRRIIESFDTRIRCLATPLRVSSRNNLAWGTWLEMTEAGTKALPDGTRFDGLTELIDAWKRLSKKREVVQVQKKLHLLTRNIKGIDVQLVACAPSGNDLEEAADRLEADLMGMALGKRSPLVTDPNATSAALLVCWGKAQVLLAGDLIHRDAPNAAWNAAMSLEELQQPVQVVNVAHHASAEAHHEGLWKQMKPQLALVTPYRRGSNSQPPRPSMIERLACSARVIITTPPEWPEEAWTRLERVTLKRSLAPTPEVIPVAGGRRLRGRPPLSRKEDSANAVAVTIAADGRIRRVLLGGEAAEYRVRR